MLLGGVFISVSLCAKFCKIEIVIRGKASRETNGITVLLTLSAPTCLLSQNNNLCERPALDPVGDRVDFKQMEIGAKQMDLNIRSKREESDQGHSLIACFN